MTHTGKNNHILHVISMWLLFPVCVIMTMLLIAVADQYADGLRNSLQP